MPIYEYECHKCGKVFENIQKFSDPKLTECLCEEKGPVTKLVSAAAFHLKGSGWYVTDFRNKGKEKEKDKDKDGKGGEGRDAQDGGSQDKSDGAKDASKDAAGSGSSGKQDAATDSKSASSPTKAAAD